MLSAFVNTGADIAGLQTSIAHIAGMPTNSQKDQFLLLGSISNYHWHRLPNLKNTLETFVPKHVNFSAHFLYDPSSTMFSGRKNMPTSPRNRLMYILMNEEMDEAFHILTRYLFKKDTEPEMPNLPDHDVPYHDDDPVDQCPPKKRRKKQTARLVSVTDKAVFACVDQGLNIEMNCSEKNRHLYKTFQEQVIDLGIIRWRYHDEEKDICVMNDINPTNGSLLPNGFVHVSCSRGECGQTIFKCTCAGYALLLRAAQADIELWANNDIIPSEGCMHCRFYRQHLMTAYDTTQRGHSIVNRPLAKVKESLQYINEPVQLVGSVQPGATTKFSVQGDINYSLIHISFPQGKCYAKCMNGMCACNMRNKKKIPKSLNLSEKSKLCSHLNTLHEHMEKVSGFFPQYFANGHDNTQNEEGNNPNVQYIIQDGVNDLDINLRPENPGHFNNETGLWSFKSLSKHKPHEEDSLELIHATQERNDYVNSRKMNKDTGIYNVMRLTPDILNRNGTVKTCACGLQYSPAQIPQLQFTANLFTRNGVVACEFFNIQCPNGTCKLSYEECSEDKGIFLYTKFTALGDEMGWDFVNMVLRARMSFTGFCNEMTRRYTSTNICSRNFISPNVFISWFFGWLAAFKIDFRAQVDPWCKYNPKILACDGTHIGVSLRNMRLEKPVTAPEDLDRILKPVHKRIARMIIQKRPHRAHLRYLCRSQMRKLKPAEELDPQIEATNTQELIQHVQDNCDIRMAAFITVFAQKNEHQEMLLAMAKLLHMLSGDAALSSVVPFDSHRIIIQCCTDALNNTETANHMDKLKHWCMEVATLLTLGRRYQLLDLITNFCHSLIDEVCRMHSEDRDAPPAQRIPNTYDPPSGTVYYFTPHGDRLRNMPQYDISERKNYDDRPEVDPPCRKIFPEVSFGGFGYIFLWFCPIHGHSYGFHMIAGGEGRKDPFAPLFKYMEEMPDHIFYDFACQLSEYCLNREPELFRKTRFWHDLFHLVGHKCGYNFKSGRVIGLDGINSEIAEQWNSFLQCIKFTASHLSQDHFVFILQFFLNEMNKKKTKNFRQLAYVALAGRM